MVVSWQLLSNRSREPHLLLGLFDMEVLHTQDWLLVPVDSNMFHEDGRRLVLVLSIILVVNLLLSRNSSSMLSFVTLEYCVS
jgi:hypothetical protein